MRLIIVTHVKGDALHISAIVQLLLGHPAARLLPVFPYAWLLATVHRRSYRIFRLDLLLGALLPLLKLKANDPLLLLFEFSLLFQPDLLPLEVYDPLGLE